MSEVSEWVRVKRLQRFSRFTITEVLTEETLDSLTLQTRTNDSTARSSVLRPVALKCQKKSKKKPKKFSLLK